MTCTQWFNQPTAIDYADPCLEVVGTIRNIEELSLSSSWIGIETIDSLNAGWKKMRMPR